MAMQTPAHVAGATPPLLLLPLMPPEDDPVVDPEDDPEDPPEPLPEPEPEPELEPLELPPGSSVVFPPHAAKVQPRSSEARTERRMEGRDMGGSAPLQQVCLGAVPHKCRNFEQAGGPLCPPPRRCGHGGTRPAVHAAPAPLSRETLSTGASTARR
jgi:hypothetical protein